MKDAIREAREVLLKARRTLIAASDDANQRGKDTARWMYADMAKECETARVALRDSA